MALARGRRGRETPNLWPGFVDMLSTLLLVVIFLMSMFMVTNYIITQAASGKDTMLSRLNRQLAELTELLALERSKKESAAGASFSRSSLSTALWVRRLRSATSGPDAIQSTSWR